MTKKEHIKKHKELHKALDELMADFITHTDGMPSSCSIMELAQWAYQQTEDPTEVE